eukprot:gene4491-biopygen12630
MAATTPYPEATHDLRNTFPNQKSNAIRGFITKISPSHAQAVVMEYCDSGRISQCSKGAIHIAGIPPDYSASCLIGALVALDNTDIRILRASVSDLKRRHQWEITNTCYHRFHHNSAHFLMSSCHEEGIRDRNRAGIEVADPALRFQLDS